MLDPDTTVSASGRVTVVGPMAPLGELGVQSSALPKPVARSGAALSSAAPRVGVPVTCRSAWTDAATLTVRWLRGGATIPGATAATYRPKAADQGRLLTCRVLATDGAGSTTSTSLARKVR
jgi:hypothetical protein